MTLQSTLDFALEEVTYSIHYTNHWIRSSMSNNQRNKVLVNGSPKTGTTWMQKLIASIPGYQRSGNFEFDIEQYNDVQPGEVVHGHDIYTPELRDTLRVNDIKTILMMRDPRDQLVSRMYHIRRDATHPGYEIAKTMENNELLLACITGNIKEIPGADTLLRLPISWFSDRDSALCVRYESLLANTVGEFSKVCHYLEINLSQNFITKIIDKNRFERLTVGRKFWRPVRKPGEQDSSSHYRKGIIGDWKNHFNETHRQACKESIGDFLIDFDYEQDHNW